jgi:hypothetical protein
MVGKRLLIVVTLLLITGIFAGWYFFAQESRYFGTSPLKAVPVDAPFFIRIKNLGEFSEKTSKSIGWQSMRNIAEVNDVYTKIVFLDSLIHRSKQRENFLQHKELIVVPAKNSMLFLLEMGSIAEKNSINSLIQQYFLSKNSIAGTKKINDAEVQQYEWEEDSLKGKILFSIFRGVLMACSDESQLRIAIEQMDRPSVLEDANYLRINKNTAVKNDLNIFINHNTLPAYLSGFYADSLATGILHPNYAKWTEVDVIQKDNQLYINGITVADSTSNCYLDVFKRQKPLVNSLVHLMPSATTFFVTQNLSQPGLYFEDYLNFLKKNKKIDQYNDKTNELTNALNINIRQYLNEYWTGEAAIVFTNQNLADSSDNRFLLMKVKKGLNDPLVNAMRKWFSGNKSIQDEESISARRSSILKVPVDHFGMLIGELYFGSIQTKWMIAGDGYILMGPTPGSLKRYQSLLQREELLHRIPSFAKLSTGMARSSNFDMWCSPGQSLPFFEPLIRTDQYQKLKKSNESLVKLENVFWQWGCENGSFYNTASLIVNLELKQNQSPFWRYLLKAKMHTRPIFVVFSSKQQEREIIFQDLENNLINLDKDGIERWKKPLGSAIIGDIKTVEMSNKGEFQLLFNTKEAIHVFDRNGVELKKFPVRLKSPATNSVVAFDYDGKRDYRFLIACSDHKVYSFDKNGKIVTGWQPKATNGLVEFPVHHFMVGSKDYIVYFDRSHTYILDRQGKERIKIKEEFVHSRNDISLIKIKGASDCMVTTDDRGKIRLLGFDGTTKKINVGNFSAGHSFFPVDFGVTSGVDFVFYDNQNLTCYNLAGKLNFSMPLKVPMQLSPTILTICGGKLIELNSATENSTILVRKDGSIFDKFLPGKYSLPVVGSFYERGSTIDWLVATTDGYLANYQMMKSP